MINFIRTEDHQYVNINMIECFCIEDNERKSCWQIKAITDCYTYIIAHVTYIDNDVHHSKEVAYLKAWHQLEEYMNNLKENNNADN